MSNNGLFTATQQLDGNFIVKTKAGEIKWTSESKGKGAAPYKLLMQNDGNLVIKDKTGSSIWTTNSTKMGAGPFTLKLGDDGILTIYQANKTAIWTNEVKYLFGSTIVNADDAKLIKEWLGYEPKLVLLFKSSIHPKTVKEFHQRCDDKGPTITIVETTDGFKFGGFTSTTWKGEGRYGNDKTGFLFSLDKKKKLEWSDMTYGIYSKPSYGPTFGGGHDLCIGKEFLAGGTNNSGSNLHSYNKENLPNTYLTGKGALSIKEVEIFSVNK